MSKSIKVSDDVYERLQAHQEPRESYSQLINRLLNTVEAIQAVSSTLGPSHHLMGRAKEKVEDAST